MNKTISWPAGAVASAALCVLLCGDLMVGAQSNDSVSDVDLAGAMRIVNASIQKAQELDTKMNIAVVDAGGNLKAFVRMDGAFLGSADVAMKKARTSRLFDAPSGALGGLSQPGGPLYGIEASNGGLITFPGGLPLTNGEGLVVGAIGVSGSSVENDLAVAQAGADAF